jgi:hypothetical protein
METYRSITVSAARWLRHQEGWGCFTVMYHVEQLPISEPAQAPGPRPFTVASARSPSASALEECPLEWYANTARVFRPAVRDRLEPADRNRPGAGRNHFADFELQAQDVQP